MTVRRRTVLILAISAGVVAAAALVLAGIYSSIELSQVRYARLCATPEEAMSERIQNTYSGIDRVEIVHAGA